MGGGKAGFQPTDIAPTNSAGVPGTVPDSGGGQNWLGSMANQAANYLYNQYVAPAKDLATNVSQPIASAQAAAQSYSPNSNTATSGMTTLQPTLRRPVNPVANYLFGGGGR